MMGNLLALHLPKALLLALLIPEGYTWSQPTLVLDDAPHSTQIFDPHVKEGGGVLGIPSYSSGKAYALLVGIDEYNTSKLKNLVHPKSEVDSLARILTRDGYHTAVISDTAATRENILSHLRRLVKGRDSTDRILFYFAGHGMELSQLTGLMSEEERRGLFDSEISTLNKAKLEQKQLDYLILALYQKDRAKFTDVIGAHEIADSLNISKAYQRILIIDACYSGTITQHAYFPIGVYSPHTISDGFFAITGAKERVRDGEHSPFLFAGLHGAADTTWAGNCDGYISAYELATFMDGVLRYKYKLANGIVYKIRYVLIGSGEIQLVRY